MASQAKRRLVCPLQYSQTTPYPEIRFHDASLAQVGASGDEGRAHSQRSVSSCPSSLSFSESIQANVANSVWLSVKPHAWHSRT